MKTDFEYIKFVQRPSKPGAKTSIWSCQNIRSGTELGEIKWYVAWRQYCYFPNCPAVYSMGCLQDINTFILQLKNERASAHE
jgi:hypothetical protein